LEDLVALRVEELARLVGENKERLVREEVYERVHMIWLPAFQDLHRHILPVADAVAIQDLVCWIVVLILERVQTIKAAGGYEDGSIRKCLS
jgi:hypothetical protein